MDTQSPLEEGILRWVSTEWLEENLLNREFMILDVQPDIHDYIEEHIPGAVYLNENLFRTSIEGIPGRFVPPGAIEPVLRSLGLRPTIPVVVYTGRGAVKGWGDGLGQSMAAYALLRYGHDNVYILDGGIDKWKEEDRPLTKRFPRVGGSDFRVRVRGGLFIGYDEFKLAKDAPDTILIDARPTALYEGQGPWIKAGHIPGAINIPWMNLMTPRNPALRKSRDELRQIFEANNIVPEKTIICYCGTGREATNEFLILKGDFGFPSVRLYEGSFTEWTSYPENPTVTGRGPQVLEPAALTYW